MNLKFLAAIMPPSQLVEMVKDQLQKELKRPIDYFELVLKVDEPDKTKAVIFRVNKDPKEIPFRDSKSFAHYAEKYIKKEVVNGDKVNFLIARHDKTESAIDFYITTADGSNTIKTHIL